MLIIIYNIYNYLLIIIYNIEYDEEEEGPKQVSVTFARQKPEFMKKMQEQSFQHHTKKSLEERWIHTNYIPVNSTQSEVNIFIYFYKFIIKIFIILIANIYFQLTRLEMFCSATEETVNTLNVSTEQYLELLAPRIKEEHYLKSDVSNYITSLNYIRTLPLLDQIRILMKDG